MRKPRVKGVGLSVYHCVSRVVGREFIFKGRERDRFVAIMRALEAFHGVRVLSYCVMSNHFHILVEVPCRETVAARIGEATILARVGGLYGMKDESDLADMLERARDPEAREAILDRYRRRMGDLSNFIKELKQRFTVWYNGQHERVGTLWESRFKSFLLKGEEKAVLRVAAYIDLNPVRAGVGKDPGEYPWSSFGAAVAGSRKARSGLARLFSFSRRICASEALARISHPPSAATCCGPPPLRSAPDFPWTVCSHTARREIRAAPRGDASSRRLATKGDEKCGLGRDWRKTERAYRSWLEECCGGAFPGCGARAIVEPEQLRELRILSRSDRLPAGKEG